MFQEVAGVQRGAEGIEVLVMAVQDIQRAWLVAEDPKECGFAGMRESLTETRKWECSMKTVPWNSSSSFYYY